MKKLRSYHSVELEVEGEKIRFGLKRLTFKEAQELRAKIREHRILTQEEKDEASIVASDEVMREAVERYVRVESDVVLETDNGDVPVKTGADVLAAFGGDWHLIGRLWLGVVNHNMLSVLEKNSSQSPTDSAPSSTEPGPDQAGPRRETTATPAESVGSAGNGDATSPASNQSGSTEETRTEPPGSSSTSAPSLH